MGVERNIWMWQRSDLLSLLFLPGGATNFAQFIDCIKEILVRLDRQGLQQD
jgi:hypothetical protein